MAGCGRTLLGAAARCPGALRSPCPQPVQPTRPFLSLVGSGATGYREHRVLGYSAQQMYELVANVGDYRLFVPWCRRSAVLSRRGHVLRAELEVGFPPLHERYLSEVSLGPRQIRAVSSDCRLFRHLETLWSFGPGLPGRTDSCSLDFSVDAAYGDNGLDSALLGDCARKGSVVSRANSIGSTSASSVPNTDDEDSDYHQEPYKESYKDQRRRAHTQAEQKRRDAIKKGYDDLQAIVPTCQQQDFSIGSQKLSKAIVLQKTIDYIQFLHKEKKKQEEEVSILRKEVMALKIMKVNYEQIVKAHQDNPNEGKDQISDQMKFNVFQGVMDSLFQSFNASISVTSFQELSACVFSWIEEHCKPQTLRDIVIGVLHQLKSQLY